MNINKNITEIQNILTPSECKLVAISKTKPIETIQEAYDAGQRLFGENKVQELVSKHEELPKDIEWHMVGHLQSNKVKYLASFVSLIHSIDSHKLLKEVNKQGAKHNRVVNCLIQIHIAEESTKFGFTEAEAVDLLNSEEIGDLAHVRIVGLMGMATNTTNMEQVRTEFSRLKNFFDKLRGLVLSSNISMQELSMGMTSDYKIAIEEGSTMVRIGSAIFGERNYGNHG